MKFPRSSFIITISLIIILCIININSYQSSTTNVKRKNLNNSYSKKFNTVRKLKAKLKSKKVDDKFLPNLKGENNLFAPIRLTFIHVDEKIEYNKRKSPMSEENFVKFMSIVIKPVEEYFKKVVSLFPVSEKTGANCQTQVPDMTPEGKKMIQFRQKADDYISNHVKKFKLTILYIYFL